MSEEDYIEEVGHIINETNEPVDIIKLLNPYIDGSDYLIQTEEGETIIDINDMLNDLLYARYYHDATMKLDATEINNKLKEIDNITDMYEINKILAECIACVFNTTSISVDKNDGSISDLKMKYDNSDKENANKVNTGCGNNKFNMICKQSLMKINSDVYNDIFKTILSVIKKESVKRVIEKFDSTAKYNEKIFDFILILYFFILKPITAYHNIKNIMEVVVKKLHVVFVENNYPNVFIKLFDTLNTYITKSKDATTIGRNSKIVLNYSFNTTDIDNDDNTYNVPILLLLTEEEDMYDVVEKISKNGLGELEFVDDSEKLGIEFEQ